MKFMGFKADKPKQFEYKPRYYDAKKEALENLKKKYSQEGKAGGVSPDFKSRLRDSWRVKEKHTGTITKGTLLVYFIILLAILYYIFFY